MKKLSLLPSIICIFIFSAKAQDGMGIGNNNPQEMLDVTGAIKIGTTSTTNAGTIRWNGTNFQGYDGSQWVNLDGSGGTNTDDQNLTGATLTGTSLQIDIEDGTSATVNLGALVDDADADDSNELQTLSISGSDITLSNGGGTVSIPAGGDSDWTVSGNDQYSAVSGNVGIGTNTPNAKLAIYAGTAQFPINLSLLPTGHATSARSAINFGQWQVLQDAQGSGIANFGLWQSGGGTRLMVGTNGNVGIGADVTPDAKLHVQGQIKIDGGTPGLNKVLTSDANGLASWVDPNTLVSADSDWTVSGNHQYSSVSGNVGIGTNTPGAKLDVLGSIQTGTSTASGTYSFAGGNNSTSSGNYSMAFGQNSSATSTWAVALGYSAEASNGSAFALGHETTASQSYSYAIGVFSAATASRALAIGGYSAANGFGSIALGERATASGDYSRALGFRGTASSYAETDMGMFSTTYTPGSTTAFVGTDRLFVVGNGTSNAARSNALTIYKNGTMNINDAYTMPTADGSNGFVMSTNGSGTVSWTDPGSLVSNDGDWTVSGNDMYSSVSGNVGIGHTTPDAELDVNGSGWFRESSGALPSGAGKGVRITYDTPNDIGLLFSYNYGNNSSTNLALQTAGGNVGIGQLNPAAKLDVGGTAALNDNQLRLRGGSDGNHYLSYIGGSFDGAKLTGFNNVILNTISGGDALIVTGNRVGIGTTAPIAPLHVEAQSSPTYGNFTYYAFQTNAGGGSCCAGTVNNVSIHASGRVMASEFDAFSDARIKDVIQVSDSEQDLNKLLGIEITDYRMKDKAKDIKLYKKVIAQQVEEVYPEAVSQITDVIPNIYSLANIENGFVALEADVQVGDRIKLILDSGTEMVTVTKVEENGFVIDSDLNEQAFVYGTEVDDFRTVDYEAISMLNVSATQELFKLISQLQSSNEELEQKLSDYSSLKADVELLKEALGIDLQSSK